MIFGSAVLLLAAAAVGAYFLLSQPEEFTTDDLADRSKGLVRYAIEDAEDRGAVCNDGSPAVYFYQPAEVGSEDKWVIWFEGGGGCNNPEECMKRWKEQRWLMTSTKTGPRADKAGILSDDPEVNPDFHAWNHVMLNYCSSDNWAGDDVYKEDDIEIIFAGHDIVTAAFEDLSKLGMSSATDVLVTGSSAGGGGVTHNVDRIAENFPEGVVRAVIDSSWNPNYAPEMLPADPAELRKDAVAFRNQQLDASCVEALGDEGYLCSSVHIAAEYLETPTFFYVDQADRKHLELYDLPSMEESEREEFLAERAAAVVESIEDLDAVFSPFVTYHTAITNDHWQDVVVDGLTFQEVLGNWYFDREGPTVVIEE